MGQLRDECLHSISQRRGGRTYLSVEAELGFITGGGHYLDDAKLFSLWPYLLDVLQRVLKVVFCRIVRRRFLDAKGAVARARHMVSRCSDRLEIESRRLRLCVLPIAEVVVMVMVMVELGRRCTVGRRRLHRSQHGMQSEVNVAIAG